VQLALEEQEKSWSAPAQASHVLVVPLLSHRARIRNMIKAGLVTAYRRSYVVALYMAVRTRERSHKSWRNKR
jgi:hypothetical protein